MKVMLIDRDRAVVEEVESICALRDDIDLVIEPIKNNAIESLKKESYDAVFFDPAPQNDELRSFMIGARRGNPSYTPIVVMSHSLNAADVMGGGANDFIQKPFVKEHFTQSLDNMSRLAAFYNQLADESEDFPSREGVISKSAFYQIFISCLDRADRYGEETYLTLATIKNIDDIRTSHGEDVATEICENLKKYTMRIRRLSDIAGRTAKHQLCLMLVRPANADEPKMAISRFSESMAEYAELISTKDAKAIINVSMMKLPSGEMIFSKDFE